MNSDILEVKTVDSNIKSTEAIQFLIVIVLTLILICMLYLINFNVFALVFDFTKQVDHTIRDVIDFISPLYNNLHIDKMIEQASEIF
jgi:hypothetical protein